MRAFIVACALVAVTTGCVSAATTQTAALPLKRLRLYETGVGYFERSGVLSQDEHAGLPIPAGHLDDALKTLVVLTPGGKAATEGVEFGSSLSHGMARAMAGLPVEDDNAAVTYEVLLASLKGSRVEVRTPRQTYTGRLVDVEAIADAEPSDEAKTGTKTKTPRPQPHSRLTVLTDHAEVVHVEGTDIEAVRPTDAAQVARIDAALEALLAHGAANHHLLRLLGKPGAPVTLGYIAETPVWRTTYRLVIGSDQRAMLQAWALLHNDTDENWQNVQVELVNGRPDSFLFPLAAPRYARRELVTPKNELSTVPQLMGSTADTLWGDHAGETFGAGGIGLSGTGEGGGGRGEGIGLGSIGTVGHGYGSGGVGESSLLEVGDLAGIAQAKGVESGALFVYGMPTPLALRAHASALVPFLQQSVEAEPIAWFESAGATARSAVRFVNSTTQTLPPGTMAFFGGGGFSGESAIDRLRPSEKRFLTFGADLDAIATQSVISVDDRVERLTFLGDQLSEHFRRTTDSEWTLENRGGLPRTMVVSLDIDHNATFKGADATDYDAQTSRPLATFRVPPRQEQKRNTTSVEGLARHTSLAQLSSHRLTTLAALTSLAARDKLVATEAASKQKDLEETRGRLAAAREEQKSLETDLARFREDAKAVGDRGALTQPLVARIVAAEDRVGVVRKRIDELTKEETKRIDAVRVTLRRLAH